MVQGGHMDTKHEAEKSVHHTPVKHESHASGTTGKVDKKVIVAVVVLALLLVFSLVQTMQLVSMKQKLQNEITLNSAPLAGKQASSTKVADSLKNLPGMVGGC